MLPYMVSVPLKALLQSISLTWLMLRAAMVTRPAWIIVQVSCSVTDTSSSVIVIANENFPLILSPLA